MEKSGVYYAQAEALRGFSAGITPAGNGSTTPSGLCCLFSSRNDQEPFSEPVSTDAGSFSIPEDAPCQLRFPRCICASLPTGGRMPGAVSCCQNCRLLRPLKRILMMLVVEASGAVASHQNGGKCLTLLPICGFILQLVMSWWVSYCRCCRAMKPGRPGRVASGSLCSSYTPCTSKRRPSSVKRSGTDGEPAHAPRTAHRAAIATR